MCKFLKDLAFRGPYGPYGPYDNLLYLFSRPRYFVGPRYKGYPFNAIIFHYSHITLVYVECEDFLKNGLPFGPPDQDIL